MSAPDEETQRLRDRLQELQKLKSDLEGALEEHEESYRRVAERMAQARDEMRARERELAEVESRARAARERSLALFGGDSVRKTQAGGPLAAGVSPEEAVGVLENQLETIASRLGIELARNSTTRQGAHVGSRSAQMGNHVDADSIVHVAVDHDGDQCGFRLAASYTFRDLTQDACRYWAVDTLSASLRDETNSLWPMSGNVREVLSRAISEQMRNVSSGSAPVMPKIRLVGRTQDSSFPGARPAGATQAPFGATGPSARPSARPSAAQPLGAPGESKQKQLEYERSFFERILATEAAHNRELRAEKHKARVSAAQVTIARSLSDVFHEPHEKPDLQRTALFKPVEMLDPRQPRSEAAIAAAASSKVKLRSKLTSVCVNLVVWVFYLIVLILAMSFRYETSQIYSNTVSLQRALTQPFDPREPLYFGGTFERWVYDETVVSAQPGRQSPRLFADRPLPFVQITDAYNFLSQVLLPSVLSTNASDVSTQAPDAGPDSSTSLVNAQQMLIGPVEIKQHRVRADSCQLNEAFANATTGSNQCFASYAVRLSQSSDLATSDEVAAVVASLGGSSTCEALVLGAMAYTRLTSEPSVTAFFSAYDASGYIASVPAHLSAVDAKCVLDALRALDWLDLHTRAVMVTFVLYNANINLFAGASITMELSHAGAVRSRILYNRISFSMYDRNDKSSRASGDPFLIFADVVFLMYSWAVMYHILLYSNIYGFLRSVLTVWNWLGLLLFFTTHAGLGLRLYYEFGVDTKELLRRDFEPTVSYQDLSTAFQLHEAMLWVDALTLFVSILLVFRYTQANRKVSAVFETVHRSTRVAAGLLLMVALFVVGALVAGFLIYGTKFFGYRTLQQSAFNLLLILMGSFPFESFRSADQIFTTFFYVAFLVIFYFLAVAFITAIYVDAYAEVAALGIQRASPKHFWTSVVSAPFSWCRRRLPSSSSKA